jgi:hypothetical protein
MKHDGDHKPRYEAMRENFKIQILTQEMLQPTNILKLFMHSDHCTSKKWQLGNTIKVLVHFNHPYYIFG